MLGQLHPGYRQRSEHYGASYGRGVEGSSRERGRMLAELYRRRQAGLMGGQQQGFEGMGGRQSSFLGVHGMSPMMGGHSRYGFPSPMSMAPGMAPGTGMGPHMGSAHRDIGMGSMGMEPQIGFGPGAGTGFGRPPFSHSPYGRQRPSPFGFGSPGPPRAHSFIPQQRPARSPFSRSGRSPFAAYRMYDDDDNDDDGYEGNYHIPQRHNFSGQTRSQSCRYTPPSTRRRHPRRMFEESEDEYDDYDDYEDDFEDEDGFESLFSRQSPRMQLRRGF